jgi:hypothetical protein
MVFDDLQKIKCFLRKNLPTLISIKTALKWPSNTDKMVTRANKKLWMLHRLKNIGAEIEEDLWVKSFASIRSGLKETEVVQVQDQDKWMVGYMDCYLIRGSHGGIWVQKRRKIRCRSWWIVSVSTD